MNLRIKKILSERGIKQYQLAEALGMEPPVVSRFISGARRANTEFLDDVATYLGLSVSDLFETTKLNVVGYIGAGAEFYMLDDHAKGAGLDTIDAPPGASSNAVAVRVRGDSMFPIYEDGDILIYSERRGDIDELLNRRAICGLQDGRILVKRVRRGTNGLYTLTSPNSQDIEDVALDWVAKIDWVQPR